MPNPLQAAGSQTRKPTHYAPLNVNRMFTGLWTQRSPLREAATPFIYEKFYSAARHDSLWDGLNVEISNKLTLVRRPGTSVYNSSTIPQCNSYYSFRWLNNNAETITIIGDTNADVRDVTGNNNNVIYTKAIQGQGQGYYQGVGNVLYFGDGTTPKKYLQINSAWTVQNWGISLGTSASTNTAAVGANNNTGLGAGGAAWTNPGNVSSNVSFASVNCGGGTSSQFLQASSFGFALNTIYNVSGLTVSFNVNGGANPPNMVVYLVKNGTIMTSSGAFFAPTSGTTTVTLGNSSYLWGTTWLPSDVNNSNFGVVIFCYGTGAATTVQVDHVQVTAYVGGAPNVTVTGAGTFSAVNGGFKYVYAYGNSSTGHCSTATPASVSTGNFTNAQYVGVNVLASSDPQVNQIRVFRTTDGGSIFLELPNSPYANVGATIQDTAADSALNEFIQAPINGNNNAPISGMIAYTYHLGRIWGALGNTVYYTRTADATAGVPLESFPPNNYFTFPSQVTRLFPCALGLLVFTVSDIYLVNWNGTGTATNPIPFLQGIGLRSYNAFDVNGSIVYMFTSDNQMISLDPSSGVSEIGFPIGDLLSDTSTWNPLNTYVTWQVAGSKDKAMYLSNGSGTCYRMCPTSAPESGLMWSPKAVYTGRAGAIQSVEVTPGVHKLLFSASGSGNILQRDLTVFSDNGTTYSAFVTIGSIVLAQPGQVAEISFITTDCSAVGSHPTLGVLIDEISGTFESLSVYVPDPPKLPPSVTLYGDRFYMNQTQDPAICRHMMLKISWPVEANQNELLSYCFFGAYHQEK